MSLSLKLYGWIGIGVTILFSCSSPKGKGEDVLSSAVESHDEWVVPDSVRRFRNPHTDQQALSHGESLYKIHCWACHGETGLGDGAAGGAMGAQPANFQDDKVREQSDGALYWKITHGNVNMPSFKEVLSDEQRWQLVAFIRRIGREANIPYNRDPPKTLKSDIRLTHFMTIEPQAIRI